MDTLRWIILGVGLLVLAGIYFWGRRSERRQADANGRADPDEPRFGQSLARDEEGWIDDVRPVRPALRADPASDGQESVRLGEPVIAPPRERALASAAQGESLVEPALDADPLGLDTRSATPGAVRAADPGAHPMAQERVAPSLDQADEEGWIDDVRPLKRSEAEMAARAARIRLDDIPEAVAEKLSAMDEIDAQEPPEDPVDVLILHLVPSAKDAVFSGEALAAAFDAFGLRYSPKGTFFREAGVGEPMFNVVNRVKPGAFTSARLSGFETPGISFFLRLPGPDQPMVAFRAMIDCARRMSARLDGRLLDEQGRPMTPQAFSQYEKRVRLFVSGLYRRFESASAQIESPEQSGPAPERKPVQEAAASMPRAQAAPAVEVEASSEEQDPTHGYEKENSFLSPETNFPRDRQDKPRGLLDRYASRVLPFVAGLKRRSRDERPEAYDADEEDVLLRPARSAWTPSAPEEDTVRVPERPKAPRRPEPAVDPEPVRDPEPPLRPEPAPSRTETHQPQRARGDAARRASGSRQPAAAPEAPEELLIIHVVANPEIGAFDGASLAPAFQACDLRLNKMHIYQRDASDGEPMFRVVNMVKPGTFDPRQLDTLLTPGISLFMQLPGPEQPMLAFRKMSECARRLAEHLGGHLEDETHSAMTLQTLGFYEERVRNFIQQQARQRGRRP